MDAVWTWFGGHHRLPNATETQEAAGKLYRFFTCLSTRVEFHVTKRDFS
jgi:hypothetical protein